MTDVIAEIAAERRRQIEEEGWTPEHDDRQCGGADAGMLARAAACYALAADGGSYTFNIARDLWPWETPRWKPKDPRRNLVRAAALIVAEIERFDRCNSENRRPRLGDLVYWECPDCGFGSVTKALRRPPICPRCAGDVAMRERPIEEAPATVEGIDART